MRSLPRTAKPLEEILVADLVVRSGQPEDAAVRRRYQDPICELCGQGELWRGRPMGLILDHINGVRDDNRLENLRIVCPNCAATLDTHCGRKNRRERPERACLRCADVFRADTRSSATAHVRAARAMSAGASRTPRCAASSVRRTTAAAGDRGDELLGRRPQVRRLRQRDPQVGAPVRARGGGRRQRSGRTSASGKRCIADRSRRPAGRDDEPVAAGRELAQPAGAEASRRSALSCPLATTFTNRLPPPHDLDAQVGGAVEREAHARGAPARARCRAR